MRNKSGRTDAKVGWSEVKARVRGGEACRENPEEVVAVEMSSDVGSSAYLPPPHLLDTSRNLSQIREYPSQILATKYEPST